MEKKLAIFKTTPNDSQPQIPNIIKQRYQREKMNLKDKMNI